MKSLRPLLLLPLAAVAAQAYTLELELGKNHPTGRESGSVVGLTVATQINESIGLGFNLNSRNLVGGTPVIDLSARTALFEVTYDLNSAGGIRPFIGAGIGYSWLSGTGSDSKSVLATNTFAGVRFALSESLDLAFTVKNHHFSGVKGTGLNAANKNTINDWSQAVSLRLKF